MSNQKVTPSIVTEDSPEGSKHTLIFENGVCEPCRLHDEFDQNVDWEDRERQLVSLLDRHRSSDGSHDCIVPGSGGKDSVFQSIILKEKYGMNPLTVTWAPHIYTDVGFKNFQMWIHNGGFDNFLYTPSGSTHRKLTEMAYRNLLHPFQPFILGQRNYVVHIAKLLGIKLIFFGENPAQYGGAEGEASSSVANSTYFTHDPSNELLISGLTLDELKNCHGITKDDLKFYLPHSPEEYNSLGLSIHWLGWFLKFHPQQNYYYAREKVGFMANDQRTEGTYSRYNSIDDKLDGFHYWTGHIKFGVGRATHEASQEVRNNDLTRDEAVALVKRYDGELPKRYFSEILEYMNMDESEFFEIADSFRPTHLWDYKESGWTLKHTVN